MRAFAERACPQARELLRKIKGRPESHNGTIEAVSAPSARAPRNFAKLLEFMQANTTGDVFRHPAAWTARREDAAAGPATATGYMSLRNPDRAGRSAT